LVEENRKSGFVLDTQVISYAIKDRWPRGIEPRDISHASISSVTALELLEVRLPGTRGGPRYYLYPPLIPELVDDDEAARKIDLAHRRVGPAGKHRTDRVALYFSSDFPATVEYGHLMIAWLLKNKRADMFTRRIAHLEKRERRRLSSIFDLLLDYDLHCLSLDDSKAQLGVTLLAQYASFGGNNLKQDFRNSLNDMLILATAIDSRMDLMTEDRALWRFASSRFEFTASLERDLMRLNLSSDSKKPTVSRESKEYVNRSWSAQVRRNAFRLS
jgi:predicted nucleic acid-binding protein